MEFAALQIGENDRIIAARGTALERLNRSPERIVGATATDAFAGIDPLNEGIERARQGKRSKQRITVEDDTYEVHFRPAHPHTANAGAETTVVLGLKPINSHDDSRVELSTEALFGHYLCQAPGALWITDTALCVVYVNGRSLEPLGLDKEKLIGISAYDVIGSDASEEPAVAAHEAALRGERQSFEYFFRGRWLQVSLEPLSQHDRGIVGVIGTGIDVTEKKRQEIQLRKSQAQLEEAQRVAHVGSFEWNMKTDRLEWTDEFFRIYGMDPADFDGTVKTFLNRIVPEDRAETLRVIEEAIDNTAPFEYEHRVVGSNNQVIVLRTQGQVIAGPQGEAQKVVGSCWDITEKAKTESRLRETVSLLESTLNATADGVLVVANDGHVRTYNEQFAEMWGIPTELAEKSADGQLIDYVSSQLKHPQRFIDEIEYLYSHPEEKRFSTLEFKDGRIFERLSIPQTINGSIIGRVWSFRDVTEKEVLLRRQDFLLEASRLLSTLDIEQAFEAIAQLPLPFCGRGCIIDLFDKQKYIRMTSKRESKGWLARDAAPTYPNEVMRGSLAIYQSEDDVRLTVPMTCQGEVLGAFTFINSPKRRYTEADLGLAQELVSRAGLAYENARLYDRARDALRLRDEFLSIAAHEIRGPIFSIGLAAETMQSGTLPQENWPRLLEIITGESRRLRRFVEDLLNVGRIRAGTFVFKPEETDLVQIIKQTIASLAPECERAHTEIRLEAPERLDGLWDADRLSQVVRNLLSNALKFGEGKPVEIVVTDEGARAAIQVSDRGIGIPEGKLVQIFDPFRRAVSLRNFGGLGLGLYIVKTIVEGMGGAVQAGHREGGGADFIIRIPRNAPQKTA